MEPVRPDELTASGVSSAAVIGGAFVAAAMALILLSLGTGSDSPPSRPGRTVARRQPRSARPRSYG